MRLPRFAPAVVAGVLLWLLAALILYVGVRAAYTFPPDPAPPTPTATQGPR